MTSRLYRTPARSGFFHSPSSRTAKVLGGHRIFRSVDDPGEVVVPVEFASAGEAKAGRERLLASGVLDRFPDKSGPSVVEEAEGIKY